MPRRSPALEKATQGPCGLARSLGVLSDPWSFLILRDVFRGRRTFTEFRESLGIATDVLAARLHTLVEFGVLVRVPYQRSGDRARDAYEPTTAGLELKVPLVALLQWGDAHTAGRGRPETTITTGTGAPVRAALTDSEGIGVAVGDVEFRSMTGLTGIRAADEVVDAE